MASLPNCTIPDSHEDASCSPDLRTTSDTTSALSLFLSQRIGLEVHVDYVEYVVRIVSLRNDERFANLVILMRCGVLDHLRPLFRLLGHHVGTVHARLVDGTVFDTSIHR
jgi:hypothetical protein